MIHRDHRLGCHGPRRARWIAAALLCALAAAGPAGAADLPAYHPAPHHGRHARDVIVLRPAATAATVLHSPRNECAPGYALNSVNACKRHGELKVRCDPDGFCEPLPPDPLPYGIGPYERLNYENGEPFFPSLNY